MSDGEGVFQEITLYEDGEQVANLTVAFTVGSRGSYIVLSCAQGVAPVLVCEQMEAITRSLRAYIDGDSGIINIGDQPPF